MASLAQTAPIPPLALFRGKQRVASLGDGSLQCVQAAKVNALASEAAKFVIHPAGILARELGHRADAQHLKIAEHGRAHGNQVLQTAGLGTHKNLLDKDNPLRYR
jgi:hypothetical protein